MYMHRYEFRPCTASFTENYVDTGYGMYSTIRTALAELATFEDITQNGAVLNGDVGLWCSDAFDVWGPATPPNLYGAHQNTFLAGKRSLFIAMLHAELAVDMVVEDDIGATLNGYKLLFLADTHVSDAAAVSLVAWVKAGGVLVATAGAGMQNEFNTTNTVRPAGRRQSCALPAVWACDRPRDHDQPTWRQFEFALACVFLRNIGHASADGCGVCRHDRADRVDGAVH